MNQFGIGASRWWPSQRPDFLRLHLKAESSPLQMFSVGSNVGKSRRRHYWSRAEAEIIISHKCQLGRFQGLLIHTGPNIRHEITWNWRAANVPEGVVDAVEIFADVTALSNLAAFFLVYDR